MKDCKHRLSIIIPIFNEEKNIPILYREIKEVEKKMDKDSVQTIFVNDASTDASLARLTEITEKDRNVKVIDFVRNFGQTAALSAGIAAADGEIIIPMDGDLQNDPKDIPKFVKKISEGYSVVSGWRRDRKDSFSRVLPSKIANFIIALTTGVKIHDNGCTLKAYRRDIIEDVQLYGEMHRFISVYATWSGGKVAEVVVNHRERKHGKSKYGFSRIFKVILDLLVIKFLHTYMSRPIHFFGKYGFYALTIGILFEVWAIILKLIENRSFIATPLPTIGIMFFIVGVQLILTGIMAELLMRTYYESQSKTPYKIKNVLN